MRKNDDPRKKNFAPSTLDFGPVRFHIARHFGFCYGVENAIEIFQFEEENFFKIINFLKKSDQVKYARHAPIPEKMIQDKKEIEEIIQII